MHSDYFRILHFYTIKCFFILRRHQWINHSWNVVVLFVVPATSEGGVCDSDAVFTLRCLPRHSRVLSTTRGSLTYIGSYISGAKSMPQTQLENSQISSRTWAMSWMFQHKGGGGISSPQALSKLVPNENRHNAPSCCCCVPGTHPRMTRKRTRNQIL